MKIDDPSVRIVTTGYTSACGSEISMHSMATTALGPSEPLRSAVAGPK